MSIWGKQLSTKALAGICRRSAIALEAGIDARRVWTREAERGSRRQRRAVARIGQAVAVGDSVSQAMNDTGGVFPPLVVEMVRAGEESGRLERMLFRLAEHFEHRLLMKRLFLAGILWPMIQLAAAVFIIGALIWAMGFIGQITGQTIDILGLGLVGERGLAIYLAGVAGVAAVNFLAVNIVSRGWLMAGPLETVTLAAPAIGGCLRTMALARFAWVLALATDSGVEIRRAVRLAENSTHLQRYKRHADAVEAQLTEGNAVWEALTATGVYPADLLDAVEVGEESGKLPESLATLSRQYEDRAKAALATLTTLAGFGVWCLVMLIIVSMILRLAMFYVGTINDAANGRF